MIRVTNHWEVEAAWWVVYKSEPNWIEFVRCSVKFRGGVEIHGGWRTKSREWVAEAMELFCACKEDAKLCKSRRKVEWPEEGTERSAEYIPKARWWREPRCISKSRSRSEPIWYALLYLFFYILYISCFNLRNKGGRVVLGKTVCFLCTSESWCFHPVVAGICYLSRC